MDKQLSSHPPAGTGETNPSAVHFLGALGLQLAPMHTARSADDTLTVRPIQPCPATNLILFFPTSYHSTPHTSPHLRYLSTDAPPLPVGTRNALIDLLASLGQHRVSSADVMLLMTLIQNGVLATGQLNPPPNAHPRPVELMRLLLRWCEYDSDGPSEFFDLDPTSSGFTFPLPLAIDLIDRGAFALGCWLRMEHEEQELGLLFSLRSESNICFEVMLNVPRRQLVTIVHGSGVGKRRPKQCSMPLELTVGTWHHVLLAFRKGSKLLGRHDLTLFLDGRKLQMLPCDYPAELSVTASSEGLNRSNTIFSPWGRKRNAQIPMFRLGAIDGRQGFEGQVGAVIMLRGVPTESDASTLYRAGPRTASVDDLLEVPTGSLTTILQRRAVAVAACFDAAMLVEEDRSCCSISGNRAAVATVDPQTTCIRPHTIASSLGGPLRLLLFLGPTPTSTLGRAAASADRVGEGVLGGGAEGQSTGDEATPDPSLVSGDDLSINISELGRCEQLAPCIVRAFASMLKRESLCRVEAERSCSFSVLAHLLVRENCATTELLDAFRELDEVVAPYDTLSDQLVGHVFLRLSLWTREGCECLTLVMDHLIHIAQTRPEQWERTEALCRLNDELQAAFPVIYLYHHHQAQEPPLESHGGVAARQPTADWLWVRYMGLLEIACSSASVQQLRRQLQYVAHSALRSGSHAQTISLLSCLLASSLSADTRLLEAAIAGTSGGIDKALLQRQSATCTLSALLCLIHSDRGCAEVYSLLLRLVGRVLSLASDDSSDHRAAASRASSWLANVSWARRGWAWLAEAAKKMPADEEMVETISRLLFDSDASDTSPMLSAPRRAVLGERLTHRISIEDDVVASFVHVQLLPPLLHMCSTAQPKLQHRILTNLSLWLQHSEDDVNQRLLAAQDGWQKPLCEILNLNSGPRSASCDLCLHLLATHVLAALRLPDDESGWLEIQRTVTFVETHTVASALARRDLYLQVLRLLLSPKHLPPPDDTDDGSSGLWANVRRFCLLVEDSILENRFTTKANSDDGSVELCVALLYLIETLLERGAGGVITAVISRERAFTKRQSTSVGSALTAGWSAARGAAVAAAHLIEHSVTSESSIRGEASAPLMSAVSECSGGTSLSSMAQRGDICSGFAQSRPSRNGSVFSAMRSIGTSSINLMEKQHREESLCDVALRVQLLLLRAADAEAAADQSETIPARSRNSLIIPAQCDFESNWRPHTPPPPPPPSLAVIWNQTEDPQVCSLPYASPFLSHGLISIGRSGHSLVSPTPSGTSLASPLRTSLVALDSRTRYSMPRMSLPDVQGDHSEARKEHSLPEHSADLLPTTHHSVFATYHLLTYCLLLTQGRKESKAVRMKTSPQLPMGAGVQLPPVPLSAGRLPRRPVPAWAAGSAEASAQTSGGPESGAALGGVVIGTPNSVGVTKPIVAAAVDVPRQLASLVRFITSYCIRFEQPQQ